MAYIFNITQRAVPTTGQTVTVNNADGDVFLIIEPAGLLANLTIATPSTPHDGQIISIMCTQIVTTLTLSVGTIIGGLATFAANGFMTLVYNAGQSKWYRIG